MKSPWRAILLLWEETLLKSNISLPRHYKFAKPTYVHRSAFCRVLSYLPAEPLNFGYEECDLPSVSSALLPAITRSIMGRHSFPTKDFKNGQRIINQTCSLFTIGSLRKSHFFPDPVAGAPASFVQRLSEISSQERLTVRHEKMKKLKKKTRRDC